MLCNILVIFHNLVRPTTKLAHIYVLTWHLFINVLYSTSFNCHLFMSALWIYMLVESTCMANKSLVLLFEISNFFQNTVCYFWAIYLNSNYDKGLKEIKDCKYTGKNAERRKIWVKKNQMKLGIPRYRIVNLDITVETEQSYIVSKCIEILSRQA